MAKKWSTPDQKWTAEDIADWREDKKYTWHELNDVKTMQLVSIKINKDFGRRDWNRFYRNNPNPTKEEVINYMIELDKKYGENFNPPVKR